MSQSPPSSSLIERISRSQRIDLDNALPDQLFSVYVLAIREIYQILRTDLEYIPVESLLAIKDTLNSIINGLTDLITQSIDVELNNDIKIVNPIIDNAYSHILAALKILSEKGSQTSEFFQELLSCRQRIFEAVQQLEGSFTNLPPPSIDKEDVLPIENETTSRFHHKSGAKQHPDVW